MQVPPVGTRKLVSKLDLHTRSNSEDLTADSLDCVGKSIFQNSGESFLFMWGNSMVDEASHPHTEIPELLTHDA